MTTEPQGCEPSLLDRARLHAALGEPARLAVVDQLLTSDRSPAELGAFLDMRSNLLARHLDVLDDVGLISRAASAGDRRRKYVRLDLERLSLVQPLAVATPARVLFVCTKNTARSRLAQGLWQHRIGRPASSAGVHPAVQVHPGAVAAAQRVGVPLDMSAPRALDHDRDLQPDVQVITVCDTVHEELDAPDHWWHWSVPDPVESGSPAAFDTAVDQLMRRIAAFQPHPSSGVPSP